MQQNYKKVAMYPSLEQALKVNQGIKNVPATWQGNVIAKAGNNNQPNSNPINPLTDRSGSWSSPTDYPSKISKRGCGCDDDECGSWGMFLGIFYFPILALGIGYLLLAIRHSDSPPPGLRPKIEKTVKN